MWSDVLVTCASQYKFYLFFLISDPFREGIYQTKQEKQHAKRTAEEFVESDLKSLIEMNPPPIMPNGNVGTPLCVFIELIRACKFPPHLIKKLGLSFPRSKTRKYGNVPFDYEILDSHGRVIYRYDDSDQNDEQRTSKQCCVDISNEETGNAAVSQSSENRRENEGVTWVNENCSNPTTSNGSVITQKRVASKSSNKTDDSKTSSASSSRFDLKYKKPSKTLTIEHSNQHSDEELEEWDRHAALHNDITSQERTKERLYEEDIELKWEKGGSGLVWYTDAAFWKQQEEADFDEETVDDWDVDMSVYEEEGMISKLQNFIYFISFNFN